MNVAAKKAARRPRRRPARSRQEGHEEARRPAVRRRLAAPKKVGLLALAGSRRRTSALAALPRDRDRRPLFDDLGPGARRPTDPAQELARLCLGLAAYVASASAIQADIEFVATTAALHGDAELPGAEALERGCQLGLAELPGRRPASPRAPSALHRYALELRGRWTQHPDFDADRTLSCACDRRVAPRRARSSSTIRAIARSDRRAAEPVRPQRDLAASLAELVARADAAGWATGQRLGLRRENVGAARPGGREGPGDRLRPADAAADCAAPGRAGRLRGGRAGGAPCSRCGATSPRRSSSAARSPEPLVAVLRATSASLARIEAELAPTSTTCGARPRPDYGEALSTLAAPMPPCTRRRAEPRRRARRVGRRGGRAGRGEAARGGPAAGAAPARAGQGRPGAHAARLRRRPRGRCSAARSSAERRDRPGAETLRPAQPRRKAAPDRGPTWPPAGRPRRSRKRRPCWRPIPGIRRP